MAMILAGRSAEARPRTLAVDRFAAPVLVLLGLVCLTSMDLVVVLGTKLTFFNDDWYFLS